MIISLLVLVECRSVFPALTSRTLLVIRCLMQRAALATTAATNRDGSLSVRGVPVLVPERNPYAHHQKLGVIARADPTTREQEPYRSQFIIFSAHRFYTRIVRHDDKRREADAEESRSTAK